MKGLLDGELHFSAYESRYNCLYHHRIYRDCALESAILAVLGQEVQLQKGEAHEFKSWMELGTRVAHGKHPFSQSLPVDVFIGRKSNDRTQCHTCTLKWIMHFL